MRNSYFLTLLLLFPFFSIYSQDCGCDHYIASDITIFDGSAISPGETICLISGPRLELQLLNLVGTPSDPITVQNCDGIVLISSPTLDFGINIQNSQFIHLSGSGDEMTEFGIRIMNVDGAGILVEDLTNHIEIDHIRIGNTIGGAFVLKDDPRCDLTANEGYYTLEGCNLHDLYINNCFAGIQIGHPNYRHGNFDESCGTLFPYPIEGLSIYNITILDIISKHGIELYGCTGEVKNNSIDQIRRTGIYLGTESHVVIENNVISNTGQYGAAGEQAGHFEFYNNLFVNNGGVGTGAVRIKFFESSGDGDINTLRFIHNTILKSGDVSLRIEDSHLASERCHIQNNIFCEPFIIEEYGLEYTPYVYLTEIDSFTVDHNIFSHTRDDQYFMDADAGNFQLTHSSPALNSGIETGIAEDQIATIRNLAGAPDAGCFEYLPNSRPYYDEIELIGLYVDDFKSVLGDPIAEINLLEYAAENGFNYLLLYNLSYIHSHYYDLTDPDEAIVLANFIKKAKEEYGIVQVGAVGEKNASFDKIEIFNSLFGDNWFNQFDVLNLEFEFWTSTSSSVFSYYCSAYLTPGGYPCTNVGAYNFYTDQLEDIDARAHSMGIISEIYIGYTTDAESIGLAERCDRILIHHYRTLDVYGDGRSIYNYHTYRIRAIALSERKPAVMPIFSSRSYHMGPWLLSHSIHQPMATWTSGIEGYDSDDATGIHDIHIAGYQWYRYTSFLDLGFGHSTPSIESTTGGIVADLIDFDIQQDQISEELIITAKNEALEKPSLCAIYNLQGKLIMQKTINGEVNRISLDGFTNGVYICVISDGNEVLHTDKIVKGM